MIEIYFILLAYTLYRSVRGCLRAYFSVNRLIRLNKKVFENKLQIDTGIVFEAKIVILIPVLREQEVIEKAFSIFANLHGNYDVYFITTAKEDFEYEEGKKTLAKKLTQLINIKSDIEFVEKTLGIFSRTQAMQVHSDISGLKSGELKAKKILTAYATKKTTGILLKQLVSEYRPDFIRIINYPYIDGVMSHQLNYALQEIKHKYRPDRTYIAVYNADSSIDSNIVFNIAAFRRVYPEANVIQQSSVFLSNFADLGSGFKGAILKGVALLQTRWTLVHELPRIHAQQSSRLGSFLESAHVVGHGLIIKLKSILDVGGFPTQFINEDLPLGYLLRLKGEKIYTFPVLENAESPTTIKSMFMQYRTWFYGASGYLSYLKHVLAIKDVPKAKAVIWSIRYFVRSLFWLLSSFVWLFLFLFPIVAARLDLEVLAIFTFLIYAPLCFFIISFLINRHTYTLLRNRRFKIKISSLTYLTTVIVFITHGYGPFLATIDMIENILCGKKIHKHKTER